MDFFHSAAGESEKVCRKYSLFTLEKKLISREMYKNKGFYGEGGMEFN